MNKETKNTLSRAELVQKYTKAKLQSISEEVGDLVATKKESEKRQLSSMRAKLVKKRNGDKIVKDVNNTQNKKTNTAFNPDNPNILSRDIPHDGTGNKKEKVNIKAKDMKFEAPQNNTQEQKEKDSQDIEGLVNSATVDEIADMMKKGSDKDIDSNLAGIGEELDDLQKRIVDMESTLKSPTKVMSDKGATTQADIDKLIKRGDVVFAQQQKLEKQKELMKQKEAVAKYVEKASKIDVTSKEKELDEMRVEVKKMDERIASGKNYQSKSEFGANDLDVNKDKILINRRDALNKDIQHLEGAVVNGKKAQEILKKSNTKTEKSVDTKGVKNEESSDTDMNEKEKFDKEVARREAEKNKELAVKGRANEEASQNDENIEEINPEDLESMDEMNPEGAINMEKGADGQWHMEGAEDSNMEELKEILDEKRGTFAQKKYKNNKAWAQIQKVLGTKERDNEDTDMQQFKDEYYEALKQYDDARLGNIDNLSPEEQDSLLEEMFKGGVEESYKLRDAQLQVRTEEFNSKPLVKGLKNVGKWLGTTKMGKTLLVGGTAMGLVANTVRTALGQAPKFAAKMGVGEQTMAMGAMEKMAFASKFLAPVGAGIGAGMLAQKAQKMLFERGQKNQEKDFSKMSTEDKRAFFTSRNYDLLVKNADKLKNMKNVSATIGLMAGTSAFMMTGAFDVDEVQGHMGGGGISEYSHNIAVGEFTESMKGTEAFAEFQEKYDAEAHAKFLEENADNENAEKAWQRDVRREGDRYELRARTELAEKGINEYGNLPKTDIKSPSPDISDMTDGGESGTDDDAIEALSGGNTTTEELENNENLYDNDDYINSEMEADEASGVEIEKNIKIAQDIAKGMGIDNLDKLEFSSDFSTINGQTVPEHLLTEEQKSLIKTNNAMNEDYKAPQSETVVQRSSNADGFFGSTKNTEKIFQRFEPNPNSSVEDITKELTNRGVDEDAATRIAEGYKNDTGHFNDSTEQRLAKKKLNMRLESYLESQGKTMMDFAKENAVDVSESSDIEIAQNPNTSDTAITPEEIQNAKDLPLSEHDEMDEYLEQLSRDSEAIKTGNIEVFQQGQKNLLELLQNTDDVSADTTMEQLNMTDNRTLRDMMAEITVRASQEFGSGGFPNDGEAIGAYLQRIGELGGPNEVANADVSVADTVDTGSDGNYAEQQEKIYAEANENNLDVNDNEIVTPENEALREAADKSLGDYQINTDIPDVAESEEATANTEAYTQEETLSAMEASDASQVADNPIAQDLKGIDVSVNGNGLLTIEKGSSIEGTLTKFLMANNDKLTEGGMGWDVDKYKDVQEWAGKRAHGLAAEFAKAHPGIDLDTVQPGTMLELNLNNLADVKVDIDFEGGAHIVPEQEKIIFDNAEDNIEYTQEEMLAAEDHSDASHEADNPTPQEVKVAVAQEADRLIKGGINPVDAKEFAEMEMAMHGNIDSIDNIEDEIDKDGKRLMQQRDKLRELAQKMGVNNTEVTTTADGNTTTTTTTSEYKLQGNVLNGKEIPKEFTQEEITKLEQSSYWKNMVDKNHAQNDLINNEQIVDADDAVQEKVGVENVQSPIEQMSQKEQMSKIMSMTDVNELVSTLESMPGFDDRVDNFIKEVYKFPADNIKGSPVGMLEANNNVVKEEMDDLVERAQQELGKVAGTPLNNSTIETYFKQTYARALQAGKVNEIFNQ